MKSSLKIIILSIIFGGLSGIILDRSALPYLTNFDAFKKYGFLKRTVENTTIINNTEKVVVKDEQNIFEILNKINPAVVTIVNARGVTLGSGVILASDGVVLTHNNAVDGLALQDFSVSFSDASQVVPVKIKQTDQFTLIKVEKNNLSVVNAVNTMRSGEKIVMFGRGTNDEKEIVSSGIINYLYSKENMIYTDAPNYPALFGAGMFNAKGEIIGLNISRSEHIRGVTLPEINSLIQELK